MTFCTIEEAWGDSFYSKEKNKSEYFKETELGDNKINKKKSFSRNYNSLKKHNGPKTRLPVDKNYDIENLKYSVLEESESSISEENIDNQIGEEIDSNIKSESAENFNNSNINSLIKENFKLKQIINNISNKKQDINSIFDLCIFLATGIFIIFLLDTLTKVAKSF